MTSNQIAYQRMLNEREHISNEERELEEKIRHNLTQEDIDRIKNEISKAKTDAEIRKIIEGELPKLKVDTSLAYVNAFANIFGAIGKGLAGGASFAGAIAG